MPRKKTMPAAKASGEMQPATPTAAEQLPSVSTAIVDVTSNAPPSEEASGNSGPPYKSIFTSTAKGFELGENRRFKQRVFIFREKPPQVVIDRLKERGFTYRPAEKAWTVEATAESRIMTNRLARELGHNNESLMLMQPQGSASEPNDPVVCRICRQMRSSLID